MTLQKEKTNTRWLDSGISCLTWNAALEWNEVNLFGSTWESKVIMKWNRLEVMLVILFSVKEKEENHAERTEKKSVQKKKKYY